MSDEMMRRDDESVDAEALSAFDAFVEPCAYVTESIPGIGGRLRERPEDFFVEELPAYEPCGEGEHIYLFVEKRDVSTIHLIRVIARHFGVDESAVGYAGLKDKVAVTRQLISVHTPGKTHRDFKHFSHDKIGILWADMHTNKLRQGHLAGNRFVIRIRGVSLTGAVHANRTVRMLEETGVPNRAGEQRFGHFGNNHLVAAHWVRGDCKAAVDELLMPSKLRPGAQSQARELYAAGQYEDAVAMLPRGAETERRVLRGLIRSGDPCRALYAVAQMQRRYYVTALQSAVFNAVLDARARAGTLAALVDGDLAWKHDSGAVFAVDGAVLADPTTADRLSALAISPSGPMWGASMMRAKGAVDEAEVAALAGSGVTLDQLEAFGARYRDPIPGKRRPLRVPLRLPDVEGGSDEHGVYVRCAFELPAGSFATVVLREVMKPDRVASLEPEGARA